jgi:hypothetical protein
MTWSPEHALRRCVFSRVMAVLGEIEYIQQPGAVSMEKIKMRGLLTVSLPLIMASRAIKYLQATFS